ncbi:DUF5590 domain-containing protein [Cohnella boryungensis]|uniref:DUF5590 domain-containing protein n=1 Tax=Cohnella boryungensis TaxID=768479 RepID=A0ABV8S5Q1_9BACL
MSAVRGEGKRFFPSLTRGKWIILIAGFVLFVLVSFVLYVRTADSEYRKEENKAVRLAKEQGGLTEVTEAVSHTWEETVWVVTGKDAEGQSWMVFEHKDGVLRAKLDDNLSREQMLDLFARDHEGKPIRMMPGWFNGQPAWEIRYWNDAGEEHQSLSFYALADGSMLKTYTLQ